jgi:predicted Fe-Mo cluster-binding NifX family protein
LATVKTAFSCWQERIAPVFDSAREVLVAETEGDRVVRQYQEKLDLALPVQKALRLRELGIGVLVCGAISRPLQAMIAASGVRVIPFVSGELRQVVRAWSEGKLPASRFFMPGCRRFGGRAAGAGAPFEEDRLMNGRGQGSGGCGGGRGQGRGMGGGMGRGRGGAGQGRGRMGGPLSGGAIGTCLCPKCGEHVAHERGVPCVQRQCPKCGTALIRE